MDQGRERRHIRKAFRHADSHQWAVFLTVRLGRMLMGTAWHAVSHRGYFRGSRHRGPAHWSGSRPENEPCDRKDREQSAKPRPSLHADPYTMKQDLCKGMQRLVRIRGVPSLAKDAP